MNTNFRETWPVCYRTQSDAGIPPGPFEEPAKPPRALFVLGFCIGLLLIGPAVIDLLEIAQ